MALNIPYFKPPKRRRRKGAAPGNGLQRGDNEFISAVRNAQIVDPAPAAMWAVYLMLAALAAAIAWASLAQVDIVTRAPARVVPDGQEQIIASLEGGILRELSVREGQQVRQGQTLALLDPTRFEAQQAEGQAKRLALLGSVARLQAEATGKPLVFPPEVMAARSVVEGETESYEARARGLNDTNAIIRRSAALLKKELAVDEAMSAKGLMSDIEVMRVRREVNDIEMQADERINRFREDAAAQLVQVRTELSMTQDQMVVRDDMLRRTTLVSPVRGIVKTIRINTVGGIVPAGAPLMEILPLGPRVLLEAHLPPSDIGFIKVGQPVVIKLSSYDYSVYGGLKGTVQSISPDALGETERGNGEGSYYRAMVRAESSTIAGGPRPLAVLPGMTGTIEIRTGERTVLGYILRPMLKSQEAFRER